MRNIFYRLLSFLVTLLFSVSLIASALAVDDGDGSSEYVQKSSFFQWAGSLIQSIGGYSFGKACPNSDDGYHHSSSTLGHPVDVFGHESPYYECICTYCGATFTAYETDLQQSYDNQVAALPAPGYGSDGALYITVPGTLAVQTRSTIGNSYYYTGCAHFVYDDTFKQDSTSPSGYSINFDCENNTVTLRLNSGVSSFSSRLFRFKWSFLAPIDGMYVPMASQRYTGHYVVTDGTSTPFSYNYSGNSSPVFYAKGDSIGGFSSYTLPSGTLYLFATCTFYPVTYKVVPYDSLIGDINAVYNTTTRPTSITGGNYGIIGDNGQITQVTDNSSIVNETTNTYYNPATGETSTITDWSYDYSDRSYNLTLEGGDTSTVTYGDQNITITETTINESGDTIINNYTIYYIIDGSGSENPPAVCTHNWQEISTTPPTCTTPGSRFLTCSLCNQTKTEAIPFISHSWAETGTTPATCTVPGSRLLTCSLCNQTKTETVPALGHSWVVRQTVTTEYDDTGELVQQGYTIFECTTCGEQYKSTDGGAPPGGGSTTGSGTSGGVFSGIFGLLTDFLGFFWNTFRDFVGEGVKGFLSSLMDGTSSIFGLLNPFSWGG